MPVSAAIGARIREALEAEGVGFLLASPGVVAVYRA